MLSLIDNFFNIPENNKVINILAPYNTDDWKYAKSIKFGSNGSEVTVKGQHYNDILYLYFKIYDNTFRDGKDSLTICIDSNNAEKSSNENVLLQYEFLFDDNAGSLSYYEYINKEIGWKQHTSDPAYVKYKINKDKVFSYWNVVIQINFADLKPIGINPDAFGLYFKVLDYGEEELNTNRYWPVTADVDNVDPYYIPSNEQWAIGRFVEEIRKPKTIRPKLIKTSKFINSHLTFSVKFNTFSHLVFRRKLRYKMM